MQWGGPSHEHIFGSRWGHGYYGGQCWVRVHVIVNPVWNETDSSVIPLTNGQ